MGKRDARCDGWAPRRAGASVRMLLSAALGLSIGAWCALTAAAAPAHHHPGDADHVAKVASSPVRVPPPATRNPSWSGEAAWASENGTASFDDVTGAWVQPAVAPSSSPQYADTWVGVDGYDGKLLQAGTSAEALDGGTSYVPWFVAWNGAPSGMTVIDEPVAPGDHMHVAIERHATGTWSVDLVDGTAGWTWSTSVTYPATGATAEWIEEAPGTWSTPTRDQVLADYGSVSFTTVRANGVAPQKLTALDIVQNGSMLSYPATYDSALGSFDVRYGDAVPTVRSIAPASGPATGGTMVAISGQNFGNSPVVRFGGVVASVVRCSTTSLVVRAPAHLPGMASVTVTAGTAGAAFEAASTGVGFDYLAEPGYLVVSASGATRGFGSAANGPAFPRAITGVVGLARDTATGGYWEVTSEGGVYNVGAPDLGTLTALVQRLSIGSVAGIAALPTGTGYWIATTHGNVYEFGAARSFGTLRDAHLASRVVGIVATATGHGYWLAASDGRVSAFGSAGYFGSAAMLHLRAPVVGMSPTPTGHGYWLAASDGGVFAFGAARYFGGAAGLRLRAPIVGIASSTTGHGYWLVASDGGVFAFGAARFCGSAAPLHAPAVALLAG
jgi:hypothetical protein